MTTEKTFEEKIKCGICGEEAKPATPLYSSMCYNCYSLFRDAQSDKISISGHPANMTYYHEENKEAKEIWFAHLRKHGFIKKRKRWVKG